MTISGRDRFLVFCGTRPEAIKLAPVILESRKRGINCKLCLTGQHETAVKEVFALFKLNIDFELKTLSTGQSLSKLQSKILRGCDDVIRKYEPSHVFVHGDTATTLMASIAAFNNRVNLLHIEAGLRTGDISQPWPEEANRILVSKIANLHFCPTSGSRDNLLNEGVAKNRTFVTGNTAIDAARLITTQFEKRENSKQCSKYILATIHRRENQQYLDEILQAFNTILKSFPEYRLKIVTHVNPVLKERIKSISGKLNNIEVLPPQQYGQFVRNMQGASLIFTDSGGIQEEAPFFKVPVMILRNKTERPEVIDSGHAILIGNRYDNIIHHASRFLSAQSVFRMKNSNPFGDGFAANRILDSLLV